MAIPVQLMVGNLPVKVNTLGQLLVAPFAYDEVVTLTIDTNDTAFNFYSPVVGCQLIITGVLITASSGIAINSLIDIYEATSASETTISKSIVHTEMPKNTQLPLPLAVKVSAGVYLNAKVDDNNVFITITGHYIPVVE